MRDKMPTKSLKKIVLRRKKKGRDFCLGYNKLIVR